MLNISGALGSAQVKTYHQLDYTSSTQRYYNQSGSVKGEWQGQLATSFGLSGPVQPDQFSRLADGQHPLTGAQLVKHGAGQQYVNANGSTTTSVQHRAGWDATFSATKSVSLTALVGGDNRVLIAHREAVTMALEHLEKYTHARIGKNHPAESTGKFIVAKFEHDTARPVSGYAAPQLHTHAVIFNVTERANGSTRALEARAFFESQAYATAVYQSALTYKLQRLGYQIETGRSGAPEIKGYTEAYLDASSPRSQQIKAQLAATGHTGAAAAQIAALQTRNQKLTLTPAEVLKAHRDMAVAFGDQPDTVVKLAHARQQKMGNNSPVSLTPNEAVTYARDRAFEREAVADERTILRDALRRGMGALRPDEVQTAFNQRTADGTFRAMKTNKYSSAPSFTTPEMIAAERANVKHVIDGQKTMPAMFSQADAVKQADTRAFFNDSQRKVVVEVLTSQDRVHGLQGLAGTGKTTVLDTIREGAEKAGYKVEGFAPTSRAAGQLRQAGIEATTLQGFLARGKTHPSADPAVAHLYLLDESSLASTRQMRAFLDKLDPRDRVLVVGDTRQHEGVDAGRPFHQMQQAGMQTAQLDRIMRQKDPELLSAVRHLANNQIEKGIELLRLQGRLTEIADGGDRVTAIAQNYAARPANTIIISPDNKSRQQINEAVRAELLINGTLAGNGQNFQTLVHRSDMTGADRTYAALYRVGEVVQYTKGSAAQGIKKDDAGVVRSIDPVTNRLTVELKDQRSMEYDPKRLYGVNVFREVTREFATGDRLQFTASNRDLGVANRDLGTITKLDKDQITVTLDDKTKRQITFDPKAFRNFDHGYAVTSHSAQGITAGRVLVNIDTDSSRSLINTRLAYVAISRASDDARIYTNNAVTLGSRLATEISKSVAVDFAPRAPQQSNVTVPGTPAQANSPLSVPPTIPVQAPTMQAAPVHAAPANPAQASAGPTIQQPVATPAPAWVPNAPQTGAAIRTAAEQNGYMQRLRYERHSQSTPAADDQKLSVLIERQLPDRRIAANYNVGDRIRFKTGSPSVEGIAHNSEATVIATDPKTNVLTIQNSERVQISYDPLHLERQTRESTVYRQETLALTIRDRLQIIAEDRKQEVLPADRATVPLIANDHDLSAQLNNGVTPTLTHSDPGMSNQALRPVTPIEPHDPSIGHSKISQQHDHQSSSIELGF